MAEDWSAFPAVTAAPADEWAAFPKVEAAPAAPPPTWGQSGMDALKQLPGVAADTVSGIGGAYTDIKDLLGTGAIKAMHALGAPGSETPDAAKAAELAALGSPGGNLPSPPSSQQIMDKIQGVTGKLPEPTTATGHAVRTVGDFMGGAATGEAATLPAFARNLVKWGLLPGAATEVAGVTADAAGASPTTKGAVQLAASLAAPVLGGRAISPLPVTDAAHTANIRALADEGVRATAGQATDRTPLRYLEAQLTSNRNAEQQAQVTRAALGRVGINEDRLTPGAGGTVDRMLGTIGGRFDRLQTANDMHADAPLVADLHNTAQTYLGTPGLYEPSTTNAVHGALTRVASAVRAGGGALSGADYQTIRSNLSAAARGAADPQRATAIQEIVEHLDDAMGRSIARNNPQAVGEWDRARRDYRNALVIEKAAGMAGADTAKGTLSPANLASAAKAVYGKRVYLRGQDDFSGLTQPAVASLPPLPDSGTAHRAAISGALAAIGGGAGYALGSKYSTDTGNDAPVSSLLLGEAGGGALLARILGRPALMNRGTQAYLRNQAMTGAPGLLSLPGALTAANGARGLLSPPGQ